ncbi:MAG: hypothetical protein KAI59_04905 [Planctomycetes bacterium]|nr:hypothetical protein [Planctomycetota bacterium]
MNNDKIAQVVGYFVIATLGLIVIPSILFYAIPNWLDRNVPNWSWWVWGGLVIISGIITLAVYLRERRQQKK